MKTALLIASSAGTHPHRHAYHFAGALAKQTSLQLIYFAGRSVDLIKPEYAPLLLQWQELARDRECCLYLCSNGAAATATSAAVEDIEIIGHATWIALSSEVDRVFSFPDAPL
jgi:predicted peroxiredoxin